MGDRRSGLSRVSTEVERERFAALYDESFDDVFGYLCRRVGRVEGEELTAQVFSLALRDRHGFDPGRGTPRAWVFGIAANVLRGHRRSEERRLRALARSGIDPLSEESDEVDARLDAGRATRAIAGVLAGLSAGDREVLLLAAWAELSSEEIGHALGIPAGTARSRLNRARRILRAALEGTDRVRSTTTRRALDG